MLVQWWWVLRLLIARLTRHGSRYWPSSSTVDRVDTLRACLSWELWYRGHISNLLSRCRWIMCKLTIIWLACIVLCFCVTITISFISSAFWFSGTSDKIGESESDVSVLPGILFNWELWGFLGWKCNKKLFISTMTSTSKVSHPFLRRMFP